MKAIRIGKLNYTEKEYLYDHIKKDKDRFFSELPNDDSYTIKENGTIIPAFITVKDGVVIILWVSEEFRRKGYGKFLVEYFNVEYIEAYYKSIPFWTSLGFNIINSKGLVCMKKR